MATSLAAVVSAPSKCGLISLQGFCGSTRGFQCRRNQKCNSRKAVRGVITAKVELQPPPYSLDSLEPLMSLQTFEFHWGKHHRAYVDNLNKQIAGTDLDEKTLEEIILLTYNKGDLLPPFNNAAQAWNHAFFWESMKPGGGGEPAGEILELINKDFGSYEAFVNEFKTAAATQFGSGWAWLVYDPSPSKGGKNLTVVKTPNAINPLATDGTPLLTLDVWEHAYYLDFQNRRPDYISTFVEKLISWEVVAARLEAAKVKVASY